MLDTTQINGLKSLKDSDITPFVTERPIFNEILKILLCYGDTMSYIVIERQQSKSVHSHQDIMKKLTMYPLISRFDRD